MALLDMGRSRGHSSIADRVRFATQNAIGIVTDWNDARRTRAILSRLSAHELDDIGLTSGDIEALSRPRRF